MKNSEVVFAPDTSYSCGKCLKCCKGDWLIAITLEEVELLKSLYPNVNPVSGEDEIDGKKIYLIARNEKNECIFLTESGCKIHIEYGFDKKPAVCKRFPFFPKQWDGKNYFHLSYMCPSVYANRGAKGERLISDACASATEKFSGAEIQEEVHLAGTQTISNCEYLLLEEKISRLILDSRFSLDDALLAGLTLIRRASDSESINQIKNKSSDLDEALDIVMESIAKRAPLLGLYRYMIASIITNIESRRGARFEFSTWKNDLSVFSKLLMNRGRIELNRTGLIFNAQHLYNIHWPRKEKPDLMPLRRYIVSHLNHKFLLTASDIEFAYHLLLGAYSAVKYYTRAFAASEKRSMISSSNLQRGIECVEYNLMLHRPMKERLWKKKIVRGWARKFLFHHSYPSSMVLF